MPHFDGEHEAEQREWNENVTASVDGGHRNSRETVKSVLILMLGGVKENRRGMRTCYVGVTER